MSLIVCVVTIVDGAQYTKLFFFFFFLNHWVALNSLLAGDLTYNNVSIEIILYSSGFY